VWRSKAKNIYPADLTLCGMNAINMCWLMLGYDKKNQWYKHNYPYRSKI
jgi:hypothetical protein